MGYSSEVFLGTMWRSYGTQPTRDEPARFAISASDEVRYAVREATRGPAPARILLPGATDYGLYRLLREIGSECTFVAPSLIPVPRPASSYR